MEVPLSPVSVATETDRLMDVQGICPDKSFSHSLSCTGLLLINLCMRESGKSSYLFTFRFLSTKACHRVGLSQNAARAHDILKSVTIMKGVNV